MPPRSNDDLVQVKSLEKPASRVWRACLECRMKKREILQRKCDGRDVCRACQSRNRLCEYPKSNDNASTSRQVTAKLDVRCQQMEAMCEQMKTLMGKFANTVESLDAFRQAASPGISVNLPEMPISTLLPPPEFPSPEQTPIELRAQLAAHSAEMPQTTACLPLDQSIDIRSSEPRFLENDDDDNDDDDDDDDDDEDEDEYLPDTGETAALDHILTVDSYGKPRFVGGTSTMVIVEALRSLNASEAASPEDKNVSILELPWFSQGKIWPRLPHLPEASQLPRPPRYVSDMLVNIYFEQLHYTLPVLYKPHFMQRYGLLVNSRHWDSTDTGFLSVFFAVCACASGLLPQEQGTMSTFTGLKFYESAILLHYSSTGEGTIEQVQCLSLCSMCSAGWNTLAQSWKFAGQAVRAAQDLGLHRSLARGAGDFLKEELYRRIWWSVYGLDYVLSTCLGRPMGVDDRDCDCELPREIDDDGLQAYSKDPPEVNSSLSPSKQSLLTGFITFSRLCQISKKIVRSMSPLEMKRIQARFGAEKARQKICKRVQRLDGELAKWLRSLPDSVAFSAVDPTSESPHLTMCTISYILHAGSVINLYRPLIRNAPDGTGVSLDQSSHLRCLDAARSCIKVAELIQERIPPSHHLAYCSHYLTLSGIILIRLSDAETPDVTRGVTTCIRCLTDLERIFSGARRSRLIIEELVESARATQTQRKRTYGEVESEDVDICNYFLNHEMFGDFSYPFIEG